MFRRFACLSLLALSFLGCSSAPKEDQLLTELANMDKTAIFKKAEGLFNQGKIKDSRKYYSFVADTFPNDPLGHKAALRVADTYAVSKDTASITEARLRYRDFANRYPNDPDRDYALLMVGQTFSNKHLRPDRDLTTLHEALDAYEQLTMLYPNSGYHDTAQKRINELKDILATHEFQVATFYAHNRRWLATKWRIEYLKEHYPDYSRMDEVDALGNEAEIGMKEAAERFKAFMEKEAKKHKKDQAAKTPEADASSSGGSKPAETPSSSPDDGNKN